MFCSSHHALCPLGQCVGTHITIDAEGGGVFMNVLMSEHNSQEFKVVSGKSTSNSVSETLSPSTGGRWG